MPLRKPANTRNRSRITNGRSLFDVSVDTRTASYRRFRDLYDGYATLLGGNPSLPQQNLIRRLATHDVALEAIEGNMASGHAVDMNAYAVMSNAHRRILECLGMATASEKPPEPVDFNRFDVSRIKFVSVHDDVTTDVPDQVEVADANS